MEDSKEVTNEAVQESHLEENKFDFSDSKQNTDSCNYVLYDSTQSKELEILKNEINFEDNGSPSVESQESHLEENNSGISYSNQNTECKSKFETEIVLVDAKKIDSSNELQISEK